MKIIILAIFMVSCGAIKYKKDKPSKTPVVQKTAIKEPKRLTNWADNYYEETILKVENPIVHESPEKVLKACQGLDMKNPRGYNHSILSSVEFKKTPLTFKTKDGFIKKAHVTRGICRELALFQAKTQDKDSGFRKKIKSITIVHIYNGLSFVTELVFDTNFKGVKFSVK